LGNFKAALDLYPMPFYPLLIAAVQQFLGLDLVLAGRDADTLLPFGKGSVERHRSKVLFCF